MHRRSLLLFPVALAMARAAAADERWPARPIRIVVPYAAGGGVDVTTRRLAEKMQRLLGQTLFVENKAGAGGLVGADQVAQAKPDGYTLLFATSSLIAQKEITPHVRFDPMTSFEHIVRTAVSPTVLTVAANSPYQNVQDLVAAVRRQPGRFNYASGGIGTPSHLAGAAMAVYLKLKMTHIPYRGSVDIGPALVSGDAQCGFPVPSTIVPLIRQGKVRALAVTGTQRLRQLPDVPTLREVFGSDDLVIDSWSGLWAPARTPKAIVDRINAAVLEALTDKELLAAYESVGTQLAPTRTPQEFTSFLRAETAKYTKLVAMAGITGT
jgi:tripartite-type tricarboxylate transporter receptor subunit TctC